MAILPVSNRDLEYSTTKLLGRHGINKSWFVTAAEDIGARYFDYSFAEVEDVAERLTGRIVTQCETNPELLAQLVEDLSPGHMALRGSTQAQLLNLLGFSYAHALRTAYFPDAASPDMWNIARQFREHHQRATSTLGADGRYHARVEEFAAVVDDVFRHFAQELVREFEPTQVEPNQDHTLHRIDAGELVNIGAEHILANSLNAAINAIAGAVERTTPGSIGLAMRRSLQAHRARFASESVVANRFDPSRFMSDVFPQGVRMGITTRDSLLLERASIFEAAARILGETVDPQIFEGTGRSCNLTRSEVEVSVVDRLQARSDFPLFSNDTPHYKDIVLNANNNRLAFNVAVDRLNFPENYSYPFDLLVLESGTDQDVRDVVVSRNQDNQDGLSQDLGLI